MTLQCSLQPPKVDPKRGFLIHNQILSVITLLNHKLALSNQELNPEFFKKRLQRQWNLEAKALIAFSEIARPRKNDKLVNSIYRKTQMKTASNLLKEMIVPAN